MKKKRNNYKFSGLGIKTMNSIITYEHDLFTVCKRMYA